MPTMSTLIMGFGAGAPGTAALAECGGKAVNLVRLAAAGLPVPPGFVVTTSAYHAFVAANDLATAISSALTALDPDHPDADALEAASASIRAAFRAGTVPGEITDAILAELAERPEVPLAVRSSATAEDLPELSFAGQQDTYLNVVGVQAVMAAIVDCWSSLWTARAIGYRMRAGIEHADTALAVVVQEMVEADSSGVMFTADPVDGRRDRVVIDATYGLGEALVSGQVEPDHYVVADGGVVVERTAGAKAVATVPRPGGGVDTVARTGDSFALTDVQLIELAAVGRRIEELYESPQDIEWAYAHGHLHVLQSRAVTSLYPLPDPAAGPGEAVWDGFPAWLSFGSFQGMLDPITPLGRDAIMLLARGLVRLFGGTPGRFSTTSLPLVREAGERLWIRVDKALRTRLGSQILPVFLGLADPAASSVVASLDEPRLQPSPTATPARRFIPKAFRFLGAFATAAPRLVRNPESLRVRLDAACDRMVHDTDERFRLAATRPVGEPRLRARLDQMQRALEEMFPVLLRHFGPIMGPSSLTQRRLVALGGPRALATLRSLDGNVTTEMDLDLWRVATVIRADEDARRRFAEAGADDLAADLRAGRLPPAVQAAITGFLDRWGVRGVGEIDLGHPRWADDPAPVMASLASYVALPEHVDAPDVAYEKGKEEAADALRTLVADLRSQGPAGWIKAAQIRFLVTRVRATFGARETPKLTIIRVFGVIRAGLLASGRELVDAGRLDRADDVLMLHVTELRDAWQTDPAHLRTVVAERRAIQAREARRRRIPRVMLGDGRTFYEGVSDPGDGSIGGSPVSPGRVEGLVRVVLSPTSAGLQPGEIMVCPGTDPAWTPLFLVAAGLVTEVGGMMTHGSVVAREYGIPAVVGVHDATTRLRTGMRVVLDGSAGTITVLAEPVEA
jgi:pyruvate,water dikinase